MSTLITILKGGRPSKRTWLYRFLAHWTPERAPTIKDSHQLRAALILAVLRMLKKPVVWLLLAIAAIAVFVFAIFAYMLVGAIFGGVASVRFPWLLSAELFVYGDLTAKALVICGVLGTVIINLSLAMITAAGFSVWQMVQRWPRVKTGLRYTALVCLILLALAAFAAGAVDMGDDVGPAAHARLPRIFPMRPFAIRNSNPNIEEGILGGITLAALMAVIFVAYLVLYGAYLIAVHLRRWFSKTRLWTLIKRRVLCLPMEWVD